MRHPPWQSHKRSSGGEGFEFHSVAKVCQPFDQAIFLLVGGPALEVVAAEVLIHRAVLEHVVDGGKDGGDDGHDRLLGAAPGFDTVELGLQVAVFLFYRRPAALYQRGLKPISALTLTIGSPFASALAIARTYASPGDEMWGRREPAHVDADLRHDCARSEVLDARDRYDQLDCGT